MWGPEYQKPKIRNHLSSGLVSVQLLNALTFEFWST